MNLADEFKYDVFLSHSSNDKAVVHAVAERLRAAGLSVWLDDWEIRAGDSIPAKIEDGLEHSRVLVLCMSANAFGSDWAQLEAGTFRFRDPLNKDRRFIPLRLDDAPIKGSLAQFLYINWLPDGREQSYPKLLEACRPPAKAVGAEAEPAREQVPEKAIQLNYQADINAYAFSRDEKRALVGEVISTVALAGQLSREFNVNDHGIDMEIEFKSDDGEATGRKLYLQLKSGDSYLRERKRGGAEIFTIKECFSTTRRLAAADQSADRLAHSKERPQWQILRALGKSLSLCLSAR